MKNNTTEERDITPYPKDTRPECDNQDCTNPSEGQICIGCAINMKE